MCQKPLCHRPCLCPSGKMHAKNVILSNKWSVQSGGEGNTGSQVCKQALSLVLRSWHLWCGAFLRHGSPPSLCWFSSVTCASPRLLTLQWVKASSLCLGRNGPLYTFCSVLDVPCLCVYWAHFALPAFLDCSCHLALKTLFWEVCLPKREAGGLWSCDGAIPTLSVCPDTPGRGSSGGLCTSGHSVGYVQCFRLRPEPLLLICSLKTASGMDTNDHIVRGWH